MSDLTPTEHRGYRELYLALQSLQEHWGELADRVGHREVAEVLRFGTHRAGGLTRELRPNTEPFGVFAGPRVRDAGRLTALAQSWFRDPFLEKNQAARLAILEAAHVANLLHYLAAAAEQRKDLARVQLFRTWEPRFDDLAAKLRTAVSTMTSDPEDCIRPVQRGLLGRTAQRLATLVGTYGEAYDQRWGEAHKDRD